MKHLKHLLILLFLILSSSPVYSDVTLHLTLDNAISRAVSTSRQLREQSQSLQIARSRHLLDIRRYFPELSISWANNATVNEFSSDTYSHQVSLKLSQFLTDGGRTRSQRELALIELLMQERQLQDARESVKDQAWNAFMGAAIGREKIALQTRALDLSRQQLEILRIELRQGAITELDFVDAELEVLNLEVSLSSSRIELRSQERLLLSLLSYPSDTEFTQEVRDFSSYSGIILPSQDLLFSLAVEQNKEYEKLEYQILQTREQIKLARRQFVPQVSLEGSISLSGNQFPLSQPQSNLSISLRFPASGSPISATISAGRQSTSSRNQLTSISGDPLQSITGTLDLRSLEASLRSQEDQLAEVTQNLRLEIENITDQYSLKKEQLNLERDRLALEKRRYRVLVQQWELGEINQLDLISANTSISKNEIALLDRVMELIQTERSIEKSLGIDPGSLASLAASFVQESD